MTARVYVNLLEGNIKTAEVTGSVVAFAKLQGLVGGNTAVPGGNVLWPPVGVGGPGAPKHEKIRKNHVCW